MSNFGFTQPDYTDDDLKAMPAWMVNEILDGMDRAEAERFLERLGRLRGEDIYTAYGEQESREQGTGGRDDG